MGDKYRTLGEKIKAVREKQGISIEDAASKAGLPAATWSQVESGDAGLKFWKLWDIAFALDVPVIELLETK